MELIEQIRDKKRNAFYDLLYGFGVWIVMCFNPIGAAELLRQWAYALHPEVSQEKKENITS